MTRKKEAHAPGGAGTGRNAESNTNYERPNIKRLVFAEYCIEDSPSAGWRQIYACMGVRL